MFAGVSPAHRDVVVRLLTEDEGRPILHGGRAVFTDSATRTWVLKRDQPTREASMAKQTLLKYPFPKSLRDPLNPLPTLV